MDMYYCPQGCQKCVGEGRLDLLCGGCGSVMTKDSTRYDAVHEDLMQQQIKEMEKQSRR
jgi:uncharacterized protein YceK